MFKLGCGHSFHHPDLAHHIKLNVMNEATEEKINCPACPTPIDDELVLELLSSEDEDEKYKKKYLRIITNNFVQVNNK